jgi:hypothetical protein
VVPVGDPLRVWWDPKAENPVGQLLDFIRGADDSLTLIALIHRARIKGGMCSPPDCLETLLSGVLNQVAQLHRTRAYPGAYHAFLSYSHRDMDRAVAIRELLNDLGVRLFQDVQDIPTGASIVGTLHSAMSTASRAVLLLTQHYFQSPWAQREIAYLHNRAHAGTLKLLPVLLDDIPLPEVLTDTFTIDLRGFRCKGDKSWAQDRLQKLVNDCLKG